MRHRFLLLCVCAVFLFAFALVASAGEARTWNDRSGRFTLEGEFVKEADGYVHIKRTDGKTVKIRKERLSVADNEYLKENLKKQNDNPFVEEESASPAHNRPTGFAGKEIAVPELGLTLSCGDRSGEERIMPGDRGAKWQYKPQTIAVDVLKEAPPTVAVFAGLDIQGQTAARRNADLFFSDAEHKCAAIGLTTGVMQDTKTELELCDLAAGKSRHVDAPFPMKLVGMSPDGRKLLAIRLYQPKTGGMPSREIVSVLEVRDNTLRAVAEFLPYRDPDDRSPFRNAIQSDCEKAVLLNSDRVVTANKDTVTLWNLNGYKAVYSIGGRSAALSFAPDGKCFALADNSFGKDAVVELRDTASGKSLGVLTIPLEEKGQLLGVQATAFSPDGGKLAVLLARSLAVFELKEGKKIAEFSVNALLDRKIVWTGSKYVMAGSTLYDLDRGLPLCSYGLFVPGAFWQGRVWSVLVEGFGGRVSIGLTSAVLPHQAALDFVETLKMEDHFAVAPGMAVRIELKLNRLADEKEAREILTERLKEKKISVSDQSQTVLVVTYEDTGEEEEVGYAQGASGPFGLPSPAMRMRSQALGKITLKVFTQTARFEKDGKTLWTTSRKTTGPRNVAYDKSKTIEETIKETNKPDNDFARFVPLPGFVAKSGTGANALTTAKFDLSGVH